MGLARGRLGVPVARLPGYSCLQPIGLGTAGSADPCLQQTNEADCRECALFTSRDGAVGLIQVGADASVSISALHFGLQRAQPVSLRWRSACIGCIVHLVRGAKVFAARYCRFCGSQSHAVASTLQELDAHQYEVLHRSQVCAQHWRSSCQTDAGGSGHQAAWTLHSHDEVSTFPADRV